MTLPLSEFLLTTGNSDRSTARTVTKMVSRREWLQCSVFVTAHAARGGFASKTQNLTQVAYRGLCPAD